MAENYEVLRGVIEEIEISKLVESEWNPQEMGEREFNRLVEELQETGQIDPIQVVPLEDGRYRILGGHQRTTAAKVLGWKKIGAIVLTDSKFQDVDLQKFLTVRLNILKGKLNPEKFALLYNDLAGKYGDKALADLMAFTDQDALQKLLGGISKGLKKSGLSEEFAKQFESATKEMKTVDDLSLVLNRLFSEYGCFPAGTLVSTKEGMVEIEEIQPGDQVYTHMGELRKVVRVFRREFNGTLVGVYLKDEAQPSFWCTPNHEIFVWECVESAVTALHWRPTKKKAEALQVSDLLLLPFPSEKKSFSPVGKIGYAPFCGRVFNLEVEEHHSYQVRGVAVGNSTVDQNFMVFVFGGKKHLYVSCSKKTWESVSVIADWAKESKTDINEPLGDVLEEYVRLNALQQEIKKLKDKSSAPPIPAGVVSEEEEEDSDDQEDIQF